MWVYANICRCTYNTQAHKSVKNQLQHNRCYTNFGRSIWPKEIPNALHQTLSCLISKTGMPSGSISTTSSLGINLSSLVLGSKLVLVMYGMISPSAQKKTSGA